MDYTSILRVARENGLKVADLCALSPNNDPFYVGRQSELAGARWFADLWQRFGYTGQIHLRRIHYQAVSQDPPLQKPNGELYENTKGDWAFLGQASKWARYLGMVDPAAFVDRRNPEPIKHAWYESWDSELGYMVNEVDCADLDLPMFPDMPDFEMTGTTDHGWQPYHMEVWAEKTTMNDVLEPLCRRYGMNLITGAGELSITAVVAFMARVRQAGRPARIFYISDFDPAGLGMPISVARKIEYFQRQNGDDDLDIRLEPLVLTSAQVAQYDLPRVPVKDSDKRKANWIRDHGVGQVELDALEALYPGELASIVTDAIERYHDADIRNEVHRRRKDLYVALSDARTQALADLEPEREALEQSFTEVIEDFQETFGNLSERLADLHKRARERLEDVDVDIDDYPKPEGKTASESDSKLYVSGRDYLEQLAAYKAYREGGQA